MRPRLRVDPARGALLDPVVADRGRGVEAVGDVLLGEVLDDSRCRRRWRPRRPRSSRPGARAARSPTAAPWRSPPTCASAPSRFWTWWPYSWAMTYASANGPPCAPNRGAARRRSRGRCRPSGRPGSRTGRPPTSRRRRPVDGLAGEEDGRRLAVVPDCGRPSTSWTRLTTPTIRQSSRWLASRPVRQVCDSSSPSADEEVPVPRDNGSVPAAVDVDSEQREHHDDEDRPGAPTDRDATPTAPTALVLDLPCVEPSTATKPHGVTSSPSTRGYAQSRPRALRSFTRRNRKRCNLPAG